MKKISFFTSALAVLALASCNNYDELSESQQLLGETKLVATIDNADITRVGMARNDEGKRGLVFTNGDLLNVYDLNSTKFCAYAAQGLAEKTGNDQVEFAFSAANSSAGVSEFDLTDTEKEFYAVTRTGADQKVYSLSAGSEGPELTMSIPSKYTKEDITAQWSDNTKSGKGYTFPLPLWGKVVAGGDKNIGTSANVMVNLRYLTGFLGINITTMRAGTKYLKITADKPISGYFHTRLDPSASDSENRTIPAAGDMPANLLAPHEALTTSKVIEVELPEANIYEGATDMFYVPLIAQEYGTLTIEAYDTGNNLIQTLYALPAGAKYAAKRGKGVTLECGMVVMSNLTDGVAISKKIDELCQRNKEFTLGLYESLTNPTTIYIDKNATSTINIQMLKVDGSPAPAVTGAITIVEATPKTRDEAGFVTAWETDVTNQNSLSATKKHVVNFIYNSSVVNTGAINFYLPNSAASIIDDNNLANGEFGANPYKGQIKSLTATDGGFTIAGNLVPPSYDKGYYNYKEGGVFVGVADDPATDGVNEAVKGFTKYLYQKGNSDVTINDLNQAMQEIQMGGSTETVTGALTINGAKQEGVGNGGTVNSITYYSTGAFTANKLDGAPSGDWKFNETTAGVNIINAGNYISYVNSLIFNKKNDLTIDNAWINTFNYAATVKATVTANNNSAIKTLASDVNDLLTISSDWNGKKLAATDMVKGAAGILTDMLGNQIHTAFQLANVPVTAAEYTMKSTTVLDMKCTSASGTPKWTPIDNTGAISINGDGNHMEGAATIKNLYNNADMKDNKPTDKTGGLFGLAGENVTLNNLVFDGVQFVNYGTVGALVGDCSATADIRNVEVKGTVTLNAASKDGFAYAGGLVGIASKVSFLNVKVSGLTLASISGGKKNSYAGGLLGYVATATITGAELTATSVAASGATGTDVAYAGGMIGAVTTSATIKNIKSTVTTVSAEDVTGGLIGDVAGELSISITDGKPQNEVTATTVKTTEASAAMATAGLVGNLTNAGNITATKVTAGLQGLLNLGGMVGNFQASGKTLKFGNETKPTLCQVAATFAFGSSASGLSLNTDPNKEAFKNKFGSANTFVGNVAAGNVQITKWCKHGTPISTVAQKEALNFKKNVKVIDDGKNKNYLFFWSGNPWVGTVAASGATISFPDANNVYNARTNETDYNVRKDVNYYLADSWTADWE